MLKSKILKKENTHINTNTYIFPQYTNNIYNKNISIFLISSLNFSLALFFIIIGSPVFILIASLIFFKYGKPIIYKGKRLGINKSIFYIYKFRTLPLGIDKQLGAELVSRKNINIPFWAKFIRETRLDELPQLFNILKRDMDFIGVRPVRPEVYEKVKNKVKNYDKRFLTKPGLIGVSQIFTPHSTSKKIRNLIDRNVTKYKYSLSAHIYMLIIAIFSSIYKFILYSKKFIKDFYYSKKFNRKRLLERIKYKHNSNKIYILNNNNFYNNNNIYAIGYIVDANNYYIKCFFPDYYNIQNIINTLQNNNQTPAKLFVLTKKNKYKSIKIYISPFKFIQQKNYIIFYYQPVSEFNLYLTEQYLLNKSFFPLGKKFYID